MLDLPPLAAHLMEIAAQASDRARDHKFEAEIAQQPACWHVIVTQPNRENMAARHLMRRGFGVYLPEFDEMGIVRGRKRISHAPLFPTYLFAFVWQIDRQWGRIAACTGVVRVLLNGTRPAVVPDRIINEIQATELSQVVATLPRPPSRSRLKRWQRELLEVPTASPKSYFDGIEKIGATERCSALHRALNLPLQSCNRLR
jgi:transcription antitermination factor NusG